MVSEKKTSLVSIIKKILDDNKATNIVTIDLKDKSSIADYMIVASGTSSRHIQVNYRNNRARVKKYWN